MKASLRLVLVEMEGSGVDCDVMSQAEIASFDLKPELADALLSVLGEATQEFLGRLLKASVESGEILMTPPIRKTKS